MNHRQYRKLRTWEFLDLCVGESIMICVCGRLYPATVVRAAFWNSDADEPDWELETTNGFVDADSVYKPFYIGG